MLNEISQKAQIVKQVIENAKKLLSDREHWTKDSFARCSNGNTIGYNSPYACKFCAEGAIKRACFDLGISTFECSRIVTFMDLIAGELHETYMINVNDDNEDAGFDMIHNLFDKAIERLAA